MSNVMTTVKFLDKIRKFLVFPSSADNKIVWTNNKWANKSTTASERTQMYFLRLWELEKFTQPWLNSFRFLGTDNLFCQK